MNWLEHFSFLSLVFCVSGLLDAVMGCFLVLSNRLAAVIEYTLSSCLLTPYPHLPATRRLCHCCGWKLAPLNTHSTHP